MASDDVIELGSSDEDSEPAPKKRKPPVNAMVHIPNHHAKKPNKLPEIKLPEITIIPSKSSSSSSSSSTTINPACIAKGSIGKSVTVTKVPKSNAKHIEKKMNGKPLKAQMPVKQFVQIPIQKNSPPGSLSGFHIVRPLKVIKPDVVHKTGINPFNKIGVKSFSRLNSVNTSVNPLNIAKMMKPNMSMPSMNINTVSVIKGPNPRTVLPPGITVKRTAAASLKTPSAKRSKHPPKVVHMAKPTVITTNEVLTVDLDDDEPGTSSATGPQWYLRPEEGDKTQKDSKISEDALNDATPNKDTEKEGLSKIGEKEKPRIKSQKQSPDKVAEKLPVTSETSSMEQQNNKESDKTTFIEITIDDSPIKPTQNKKGFKVGAELAIIIEDSPVKNTADKTVPSTNSDDDTAVSPKERNSKKKLEYPKTIEMLETVEIEFEPFPIEKPSNTEDKSEKPSNTVSKTEKPSNTKDKSEKLSNTEEKSEKPSIPADNSEKPKRVMECIEVVEIEESPVKPPEIDQTTTPKKNKPSRPPYKPFEIETVVIDDKEKEEFHSVYQSFIELCFQLENSEDMKKIVEKKIKAYYRQVPKEYTNSEAFTDMVSSKIMAMKAGPEKMYLYIKDVVDELNLQRKMAKAQPPAEVARIEEQNKFLYGEESEFDAKRQRQIRKLEKTLKKLHRAIQKLEEQEVDFDDEEDSVYLLTDSEDESSPKEDKPLNKEVLLQRYKERMVRVHAKLCQLTNTKMPSEARVVIDARPGQPKGPAKRLEKWINRKVPIGKPLPFPDFHDVVRCVRDANQEDKLGWNEADIMSEARDLFTRCGKKLQRRRQENEWRLAASRIPADEQDPAEASTDLKIKLEENRRMSSKKESEVFNKYADRQNQLNLEAVEIGDKEAEESPVESDDEEPGNDTVSLISKQKRKERIKRLLKGKSKKVSISEKENKPDGTSAKDENFQNENNTVKDSKEPENSTKHVDKLEDQNPLKPESPLKSTVNSDLQDTENKGAAESDSCSKDKDDTEQHSDKVHSLSDDSDKVESDVDELHLLLRLRSKNECNPSPTDSSDSATPIAISDSTSTNDVSSDEHSKKQTSDVISIENSSYSESDEKKSSSSKDLIETDDISTKKAIEESIDATMEIECSNDGVGKNTNNEINIADYNPSLEDVLLASSDDADDTEEPKSINPVNETSVNLRDDTISIGETVIEPNQKHCKDSADEIIADNFDKDTNTDASSVEGMEIGPTEIKLVKQNGMEVNVDTLSVKSADDESVTDITTIKSPEVNEKEHADKIRAKSVETIEYENTNDTKSVKSVETIEEESFIETIDESVITNDETIAKEKTIVGPANAISDTNVKEITRNNPVDTVADRTVKEPESAKSVETLDGENVDTIQDGSASVTTCVKSVINIDNDIIINNSENLSKNDKETVDAIESRDFNDTTSVKSDKTIEEKICRETIVESGNIATDDVALKEHEPTSVKSVETIDGKSIEVVQDKNLNETAGENIDSVIITENSIDSSKNEKYVEMDITENTKSNLVEEIKNNSDAIPEPTDVDSNVEQNFGI